MSYDDSRALEKFCMKNPFKAYDATVLSIISAHLGWSGSDSRMPSENPDANALAWVLWDSLVFNNGGSDEGINPDEVYAKVFRMADELWVDMMEPFDALANNVGRF